MLNGKSAALLTLGPENNDLLHQFVLKDLDPKGGNEVELRFRGKGRLGYQVAGQYFIMLVLPVMTITRASVPSGSLILDFSHGITGLVLISVAHLYHRKHSVMLICHIQEEENQ